VFVPTHEGERTAGGPVKKEGGDLLNVLIMLNLICLAKVTLSSHDPFLVRVKNIVMIITILL
jgi:hypothetical protein